MRHHFVYFCAIYFTQLISLSSANPIFTIKCFGSQENCTIIRYASSPTRTRQNSESLFNSNRYSTTTPPPPPSPYSQFSRNFKIAALVVAGVALGLGLLRLCLLLCNRSSHSAHNRHTAVVRPQIAVVGHHRVKPDLPPAYAEAVANAEQNENKLPSYAELHTEQPESPRPTASS